MIFIWEPIESAPRSSNKKILLKTHVGIVPAWFDKEKNEWVCFDDIFSLDGDCPTITGWTEYPF